MTLSLLLDLDDERAKQATHHFISHLQAQPGFSSKLMKLFEEIAQNDHHSALTTLMTCFGIDGPEASIALMSGKFAGEFGLLLTGSGDR